MEQFNSTVAGNKNRCRLNVDAVFFMYVDCVPLLNFSLADATVNYFITVEAKEICTVRKRIKSSFHL